MENAVITANDYLIQVNAEDAARQSLVLHQLQLRQAQINYAITTGQIINNVYETYIFFHLYFIILLQACGNKKENYDASGSFEADEVLSHHNSMDSYYPSM